MARPRVDPDVRFDAQVIPEPMSGCLLWTGVVSDAGHGRFGLGGRRSKMVPAHRYAWERVNGPMPEGKLACHKCDVPSCVNPDHIYAGSRIDNARDAVARGQQPRGLRHGAHTKPHRRPRGEAHGCAKLSEEQVIAIRARRAAGESRANLARAFGVSIPTVKAIIAGRRWRHLQ